MGDGKLRIRMQKLTVNYAGSEWPKDGVMGGLIDGEGAWAEPATENPNDYEIHLCRWGGDFGSSGPTMFNFNNVNHWTIKGINFALVNRLADATNSSDVTFSYCAGYLHWSGIRFFSGTANWLFDHCKLITGDVRHMMEHAEKRRLLLSAHALNSAVLERDQHIEPGPRQRHLPGLPRCPLVRWVAAQQQWRPGDH